MVGVAGWQEMEVGRWQPIMATSSLFEPKGLWGIWETSCWLSEKANKNLVGETRWR